MAPPSSASLVAALGSLAVGAVVLARRRASPGTRPLVALSIALAAWHLCDFYSDWLGSPAWMLWASFGTTMVVPTLVHFVVATVRIRDRWLVPTTYAVAVAFLPLVVVGLLRPRLGQFFVTYGWIAFLVVLLPAGVVMLFRLVGVARTDKEKNARLQAWRLVVGVALGLAGGVCDLVAMGIPRVPKLGAAGTILGTLALGWSLDVHGGSGRALATRSALLAVALTGSAALLTIAVSDLTEGRSEVVLLVASGTALAALAAFRIGTARMQRDAMQMQSLALLGTFAAEVAHEVRNPLAAIRGAVQFLREEARRGGVPDTLQSYLELVDDEVGRLDAVVTDYHSLARTTALRNQKVDVGKVVRDLVALHGRVVPAGIEVKVEVAEGLPTVLADAGRLRQALLNLVRNAVAAMPEGGTLSLRARSEQGRKADASVLIEVEDTGVGIRRENLKEIFKPHFSTSAGGSGLGLAVTQRIAEEHGGMLLVRSHTGGGSTFILVLPTQTEAR